MKTLHQYIKEKLIINKDYRDNTIVVKSFDELLKIIEQRYEEYGPGTKQNPIDFNDIDVSNIDSFYNCNENKGIFSRTDFKYIDISYWDVSNITSMRFMFYECYELESIGDLSDWNVSNVTDMSCMFYDCTKLKSIGDLSKWDVSKVESMEHTFYCCYALKTVGDLSKLDVSKVESMISMFAHCKTLTSVGDLSNWDVSNVKYMSYMFHDSGIKNTPSWHK